MLLKQIQREEARAARAKAKLQEEAARSGDGDASAVRLSLRGEHGTPRKSAPPAVESATPRRAAASPAKVPRAKAATKPAAMKAAPTAMKTVMKAKKVAMKAAAPKPMKAKPPATKKVKKTAMKAKAMKAPAMKAAMKAMKAKAAMKAMKAKKSSVIARAEDEYAKKFTKKEQAVLRKLNTPQAIQNFIDALAYDGADHYYSVRRTLQTKSAHCMGGAILAAYCLEQIGLGPPRVCSFDAENDDTHAVAVYQVRGFWGAIGKSNFTLIRSRDPVYRSLRELMMSYFDFYFNTKGEKSMVGYSQPFNLARTGEGWKFAEGNIDDELEDFDDPKKTPVIRVRPPGMRPGSRKGLLPAPKYLLQAGLLGSNPKGLFKPS